MVITVCSACKRVKISDKVWGTTVIMRNEPVSHGLCPDCRDVYYTADHIIKERNRLRVPLKIAVSGGECSGITTLASLLASSLGITYIEEGVRTFIEQNGYPRPSEMNLFEASLFERTILDCKINNENKLSSFVSDRSTADSWGYASFWCSKMPAEWKKRFCATAKDHAKKYDLVIFLWSSISFIDDGNRTLDPVLRQSIQNKIHSSLESWGVPLFEPRCTHPMGRLNECLTHINELTERDSRITLAAS